MAFFFPSSPKGSKAKQNEEKGHDSISAPPSSPTHPLTFCISPYFKTERKRRELRDLSATVMCLSLLQGRKMYLALFFASGLYNRMKWRSFYTTRKEIRPFSFRVCAYTSLFKLEDSIIHGIKCIFCFFLLFIWAQTRTPLPRR